MGYINFGYEVLDCPTEGCGLSFAMERGVVDRLRENNKTFYCPHGHSQWFKPHKKPAADSKVRQMQADMEACENRTREFQRKWDLQRRRAERAEARLKWYVLNGDLYRGVCRRCDWMQPRGSKNLRLAEHSARIHERTEHGMHMVTDQPQADVDAVRDDAPVDAEAE